MSFNFYTCSQADLESLNDLGPKSASDIFSMRNEVLGGKRPQMTITDLASIRLRPEIWQQFINDGLLSITFHAAKDPDDKVMVQASPTDKLQFTGQTTTATAHAPVIPTQTVTGQIMTMTVQTPITAAQMPTKQTPIHAASLEELIQESVKILAHHVDDMAKQMHGLGTTLIQKITMIADTVGKLQQQNSEIKLHLHPHDMETFDSQSKLSIHDTFFSDINKWLPPLTPVSSMLPILKEPSVPTPQPTTTPVSGKSQVSTNPVISAAQLSVQYTAPIPSAAIQTPNVEPILTQPVAFTLPPRPQHSIPWRQYHKQFQRPYPFQ